MSVAQCRSRHRYVRTALITPPALCIGLDKVHDAHQITAQTAAALHGLAVQAWMAGRQYAHSQKIHAGCNALCSICRKDWCKRFLAADKLVGRVYGLTQGHSQRLKANHRSCTSMSGQAVYMQVHVCCLHIRVF